MYQPCNLSDPCQRLDLFVESYNFTDIPDYCDFFVGMLCIGGPYEQTDPVFNKFKNLTALIGQIQVMGTLWNNLDTFSSLQHLRYYELSGNFYNPGWGAPSYQPCGSTGGYDDYEEGTQNIQIGLSRFLNNFTFASLEPAINVSLMLPQPGEGMPFMFDMRKFGTKLDKGICNQFFNKFNCQYAMELQQVQSMIYDWIEEAWIVGWFLTVISLLFTTRSLILLLATRTRDHLPKSQFLYAFVVLLIALEQVQSCLFDERAFQSRYTQDEDDYIFSSYSNVLLSHPLLPILVRLLTAWKYAAMVIVIFCYVDIILFYRVDIEKRSKYSQILVCGTLVLSIAIFAWAHQQLFVAIRVLQPKSEASKFIGATLMADRQQDRLIIPFVMHVDGIANFTNWAPESIPLQHSSGSIEFPFYKRVSLEPQVMHLDILGDAFPNYCLYCDLAMLILLGSLHLFRKVKLIETPSNFNALLLVYLQLSMFRIRAFIHYDVMWSNNPLHYTIGRYRIVTLRMILFYPDAFFQGSEDYGLFETQKMESDKKYGILSRVTEKSPVLTLLVVSFYCYRFVRYHCYLSLALILRRKRKETIATSITEEVSDLAFAKITN